MSTSRFRFSLMALLGAVLVLSVCLAALRDASGLLAGTAFTFAIFLLLFGLLAIALDRREMRRFWITFSAFGWTYLVLTCAPWFSAKVGPHLVTTELVHWLHPHVVRVVPPTKSDDEEHLAVWIRPDGAISVEGLEVADENELVRRLQEESQSTGKHRVRIYTDYYNPHLTSSWLRDTNNRLFDVIRRAKLGGGISSATTQMIPELRHFLRVAHCLMSLLLAVLGGLAARWFFPMRHAHDVGRTCVA